MNEQKSFRVKINDKGFSSVSDFAKWNSTEVGGELRVCFQRAIGESVGFVSEAARVESAICNSKPYFRVENLPQPATAEDISYYTSLYSEWLRCGKNQLVSRSTKLDYEEKMLSDNCQACLEKLRLASANVTADMEKNFFVKVVYRFDELKKQIGRNDYRNCFITAQNVTKLHDYLFYYLLVLMGANVLLFQNSADIDTHAQSLSLSYSFVIGQSGLTKLPPYKDCKSQNVRVTIPVRSDRVTQAPPATGTNILPQSGNRNGNVKVTIPVRSDRVTQAPPAIGTNTLPQSGTQNGNVKVTIPVRSDRVTQAPPANSTNTSQPRGAQAASVRVNIPPHPNRATIPPAANHYVPVPQAQPVTVPRPQVGFSNAGNLVQNRNSEPCEKSYEELAQLASSVVMIFRKNRFGEILSTGSGVMIGENGYILTNLHVLKGDAIYDVRIENEERVYRADGIIKYNTDLDLAVIRIDRKLRPLPIYDGRKPLVRGQKVIAIGSPHGLFNSVSDGIISGFRRVEDCDMIQFTAPVSCGSSGGAVINMYGELVGVSTMIHCSEDSQNINFAVAYESLSLFTRGFT